MKTKKQRISVPVTISFFASCLFFTNPAMAQQNSDDTSPYEVEVALDFEINVPRVLFFRVGTAGATVDTVEFDLNQSLLPNKTDEVTGSFNTPLGSGTAVNATTNGQIEVEVKANFGGVKIITTVDNSNGLDGNNGYFINYNQIATTSSDAANFPAPVLANSNIADVDIKPSGFNAKVTERTAAWTYKFLNQTEVPAGTYEGEITYTASTP